MIVVVWHPNKGHRAGEAQCAAEMTRAARCRVQLRHVQHRSLARAKKVQARRKFFEKGAPHGRGECRVVPGGEPGRNALGPDTDAFHRGLEGPQSAARKFVGVLLAGEALFLVIANDARPVGA